MSDAPPARSHFISAQDGLRLHARVYGSELWEATPVVCLPGLARAAADFDALAQALVAGSAGRPRRVVALDYRGRGLSERDSNPANYDLRVENADVLACLDALGVEHAAFVGTSRGGLHILMLAATRPCALKAAVLNDVGPVIEAKGLARIRSYVGRLPTPASWADATDLVKSVMGGQFTQLSDEEWRAYAALTFEETDRGFVTRYDPALTKALDAYDLDQPLPTAWPQFEGLASIPTLCMRGEHSDLLSEETVAEMGRRHPRFQAHMVAGQGHAPLLLDKPTIERVSRFVAGATA